MPRKLPKAKAINSSIITPQSTNTHVSNNNATKNLTKGSTRKDSVDIVTIEKIPKKVQKKPKANLYTLKEDSILLEDYKKYKSGLEPLNDIINRLTSKLDRSHNSVRRRLERLQQLTPAQTKILCSYLEIYSEIADERKIIYFKDSSMLYLFSISGYKVDGNELKYFENLKDKILGEAEEIEVEDNDNPDNKDHSNTEEVNGLQNNNKDEKIKEDQVSVEKQIILDAKDERIQKDKASAEKQVILDTKNDKLQEAKASKEKQIILDKKDEKIQDAKASGEKQVILDTKDEKTISKQEDKDDNRVKNSDTAAVIGENYKPKSSVSKLLNPNNKKDITQCKTLGNKKNESENDGSNKTDDNNLVDNFTLDSQGNLKCKDSRKRKKKVDATTKYIPVAPIPSIIPDEAAEQITNPAPELEFTISSIESRKVKDIEIDFQELSLKDKEKVYDDIKAEKNKNKENLESLDQEQYHKKPTKKIKSCEISKMFNYVEQKHQYSTTTNVEQQNVEDIDKSVSISLDDEVGFNTETIMQNINPVILNLSDIAPREYNA